MLINAFAVFAEVSPKILSDIYKREFRTIPQENRQCSLNQGLQLLARNAGFKCYQSMTIQDSVLIRTHELIDALKAAGLSNEMSQRYAHFSRLLRCDVLCSSDQQLCIAIDSSGGVIETPFLSNPSPYIPNFIFYPLTVHGNDGMWLTLDEWESFVKDLKLSLNHNNDIEWQIEEIWNNVSTDSCGELFLSSNPDWDELADCSEGRFRQCVLEYAGHTPLDFLYSYFSSERSI